MKRIVLLLLLSGLAFTGSAQLLIGPKIGVNFATLRAIKIEGDDKKAFNDNNGYNTGMQFGLALNKGINQRIAFQTELLFTQLGTKTKAINVAGVSIPEHKYNFSYLQIPAMIKVIFGSGDLNFFINAGPYLGYWTARQVDGDNVKFETYDNRWDVGLNGGAGIGMKAGPGLLTLEGRYGFGLLSNRNDNKELDATNRAIGISLAYLFGNVNDE